MPELPEVQSIVDYLNESKQCLNKKILDIKTTMPKLFKNCSFEQFRSYLLNECINKVERKGKYLIFFLTNNKVFVLHLRMEGKVFVEKTNVKYDKNHTLVFINFGEEELRYHDTRRFGTFNIYTTQNYLDSKELSKLAYDPLEKQCDANYLKNQFKNCNKHIKTALLDQTKVAGIGNIYADEILFASKINPLKKASSLNAKDFELIYENAKLILQKAVENKGTTIATYFFKKENFGNFQNLLKVHTKKDFPCEICKAAIKKIKVNGRGTYYCALCQK